MATRAEITSNIENKRREIFHTVDEISDTIHKKFDAGEYIRSNPYAALGIAAIAGFTLASFSSPLGRTLFKVVMKSAYAAAGAYISKKGMDFVSNKVVHH